MEFTKDDIIGKEFLQNCGDTLLVIEKTNKKYKDGSYLFRCKFQKYSYEKLAIKRHILSGQIINPQIEQVEFIDKIHPQNCGDSLKIIKKSDKKGYWECEFVKYHYKVLASKQNILNKLVNNPLIEENEFIGKIFSQNCGDDLKVLRKTNIRQNKNILYECEFLKYPCKILTRKDSIKLGNVLNPLIEENEFIGKEFPQNCGDTLRVLEKTEQKDLDNHYLYKCEFTKYISIGYFPKYLILKREVVNKKLPYYFKEGLKEYIETNFKDKKPTLTELASSLNISISHIGHKINEFDLRDYISYTYTGLENQIKDFLKELNTEFKENYWNKEIGKEIDIYLPNKNLGIEVNGNYWHSNHKKHGILSLYHQEKSLACQKQNIQLIHIFEYEWNNFRQQEILKSLIKSKLGIFEKKIYARQCKIKELDYKIYADFCNQNHLQRECGAKIKLGLYYEEELIQVMSFGVPRFTDKYEWEIIRECSKLGYITIGGKEKLWKYFLRKYNPNNCISYCDFSKFIGESYLKLGFKKIGLNKPGFVWWDFKLNITYLRSPWKHQEMKEKGYLKIYDAGQLVFEYKI